MMMRRSSITPTIDGNDFGPLQAVGPDQRRDMYPSVFRGSRRSTLIWSGALIALIAIVDWRVLDDLPLGFLYLLPMLMLGRVLRPWQTILVAGLCTYLTEEFDQFAWNLRTGLPRDVLYFVAFFSIGVFVYEVNRNRQIVMEQLHEIELSQCAQARASCINLVHGVHKANPSRRGMAT